MTFEEVSALKVSDFIYLAQMPSDIDIEVLEYPITLEINPDTGNILAGNQYVPWLEVGITPRQAVEIFYTKLVGRQNFLEETLSNENFPYEVIRY